MGASESKLAFKQGVFKLYEQKHIAADDHYWASFWELPESAEDVFSLFSPNDICRIRDEAFDNLETLLLAVTSRLFALHQNKSFPNSEQGLERDALNCIRILTRILPFIFEAEHLEDWEETFFWSARRRRTKRAGTGHGEVLFDGSTPEETPDSVPEFQEAKPLAEELIDVLLELLFFSNLTVPPSSGKGRGVNLAIWQTGVGCNTAVATSLEMEERRMEILRLLLTLAGKSMYTTANILPVQGSRALTYMTSNGDKQMVLSLLCSLLNTSLKYNPVTWRVPYDHVLLKDPKQIFVTYCLQLLLVLVLYPVPESSDGPPPRNNYRHFLGRLHRAQDFQFLVDGMTRILNQPMQASASYLPGSQRTLTWAPEMIMLFWEVLQCNKRFRSFVIEKNRAHDFVILVLFNALHNKSDPSKHGIVRMCIFVLQTMSVEPAFGERLNIEFKGHDALPQSIRIPDFRGSYADFVIISIHTLITSTKAKLDAIYPALLAILNNVAAYLSGLASISSAKLLQLFSLMSSPSFLLANESNHQLLSSLLEAFNAIIEHQYEHNAIFVYHVVRSAKRFSALRDFTIEGGQAELERQAQKRKELSQFTEYDLNSSRDNSLDGQRSPVSNRASSLNNIAEDTGAFAIGDDESDDNEEVKLTPAASSVQSASDSRHASVSGSAEDVLPTQIKGMSEKARGKLPAGQSAISRVSSNTSLGNSAVGIFPSQVKYEPDMAWIESWHPQLPLQTILTLIEQLRPQLPPLDTSSSAKIAVSAIKNARGPSLEVSPVRVHLFEWSPLSLGWYESLLWSFIFSTEMAFTKGAPSVWKGTNIKLFKVQEVAAQGPSLLSPQGAVDAVGSNLVKRIGSLNIRGAAQPSQRNSSGGITRDV